MLDQIHCVFEMSAARIALLKQYTETSTSYIGEEGGHFMKT